jgi:hypothetical protein
MAHPTLTERLERLSGCAGVWILDERCPRQYGSDLRRLPTWDCKTPGQALERCITLRWRDCRLLFSADALNGDSGYGYTAPTVYRSNERVFRAEFAAALERADGDADGVALDLRFITEEMLEAIESLQDYPILDECDHSELEHEAQQEEWESWGASDWRGLVESKLADALQSLPAVGSADAVDADEWAEEALERYGEEALYDLFRSCADAAGEYWQEESGGGFWIRLERCAAEIGTADLAEIAGVPAAALDPEQAWRFEPYPWVGASAAPLLTVAACGAPTA